MPRHERFDEDDEQPRRRRRLRRDDWDEPRAATKPGLATAAGILWLIWGGLLLLVFVVRLIAVLRAIADDADLNFVCGGMDVLLVLGIAGWSGLAGLLTVLGKARSLGAYGFLSLALPPLMVVLETVIAFFTGMELVRDHDRLRGDLPLILAFRSFVFNTLLVSGVVLAGIFALVANRRYREWYDHRG